MSRGRSRLDDRHPLASDPCTRSPAGPSLDTTWVVPLSGLGEWHEGPSAPIGSYLFRLVRATRANPAGDQCAAGSRPDASKRSWFAPSCYYGLCKGPQPLIRISMDRIHRYRPWRWRTANSPSLLPLHSCTRVSCGSSVPSQLAHRGTRPDQPFCCLEQGGRHLPHFDQCLRPRPRLCICLCLLRTDS